MDRLCGMPLQEHTRFLRGTCVGSLVRKLWRWLELICISSKRFVDGVPEQCWSTCATASCLPLWRCRHKLRKGYKLWKSVKACTSKWRTPWGVNTWFRVNTSSIKPWRSRGPRWEEEQRQVANPGLLDEHNACRSGEVCSVQ